MLPQGLSTCCSHYHSFLYPTPAPLIFLQGSLPWSPVLDWIRLCCDTFPRILFSFEALLTPANNILSIRFNAYPLWYFVSFQEQASCMACYQCPQLFGRCWQIAFNKYSCIEWMDGYSEARPAPTFIICAHICRWHTGLSNKCYSQVGRV